MRDVRGIRLFHSASHNDNYSHSAICVSSLSEVAALLKIYSRGKCDLYITINIRMRVYYMRV